MRSSLSNCHKISDLQRLAKRRLPLPMWDFLEGGAEDELTLVNNTKAFDNYTLKTRSLVDVSNIDLTTEIFGQRVAMPLFFSPTGGSGLWHPEAELAVARAAAGADIFYGLSTGSTKTMEQVAAEAGGPKMFQLYAFKDTGLNREFIKRSSDCGYKALCLTVDAAAGAGNRERDTRNGLSPGDRLTLRSLASIACHTRWAINTMIHKGSQLGTIESLMPPGTYSLQEVRQFLAEVMTASLTWPDAAALAKEWNGHFAIKGILTPEDARKAVSIGAKTIIVSNHGGRQMDGVDASINALPAIAEAVGDQADIILDGGVRRGSHMIKALALGAKAVMVGRPYLYGLAAGGEAGVTRAIDIFRTELRRGMALLGVTGIDDIDHSFVSHSFVNRSLVNHSFVNKPGG